MSAPEIEMTERKIESVAENSAAEIGIPEREREIEGMAEAVVTVSPETVEITNESLRRHIIVPGSRLLHWYRKLWSEGTQWFDASTIVITNQMSQMLLLLPCSLAKLGWWRVTLATAIFGFLSCWTAHIVQVFYFRCYRSASAHHCNENDEIEIIQLDKLLYGSFHDHGHLKKLGMLGMGFNCFCLLTRSIIQLTYAVSITYFINDKMEKRNWTYILAACILFAFVPIFRNYRILSILGFVMATVAALSIAVASLLHQPVQGVQHSVPSCSIWSLAWVSSTIVYAFGDTSASVESLVVIKEWDNQNQFKYAFWGSTAYTTALSLGAALSSYWAFGNQLSEIPPGAQPCALALLPSSHLRDIASISLLILELVAIGYSLCPLFMYIKRLISLLSCETDDFHVLLFMARAFIVVLVCIIAAAIPFSGSMEITSLVGSLIVSLAIYIIPAAAHMLYFQYSRHCEDDGLRGFSMIASYMINIIQFTGVLIFVTIMGGKTSINKVFHSHHFHRSDFWNGCYLCADLQLSPALGPITAPAPSQFVHCFKNNISMSNRTRC